jgi:predicted metal-dependent HD superfamily phosphohydrolase
VRREYWWVPAPIFRRERVRILRSFLERPHVYNLDAFRDRYEAQARRNVAAALAALDRG